MKRSRNTLGPLIGYHGCDRRVGESVHSGIKTLQPSQNDYDWLAPGICFWVDSQERGIRWARVLGYFRVRGISGVHYEHVTRRVAISSERTSQA